MYFPIKCTSYIPYFNHHWPIRTVTIAETASVFHRCKFSLPVLLYSTLDIFVFSFPCHNFRDPEKSASLIPVQLTASHAPRILTRPSEKCASRSRITEHLIPAVHGISVRKRLFSSVCVCMWKCISVTIETWDTWATSELSLFICRSSLHAREVQISTLWLRAGVLTVGVNKTMSKSFTSSLCTHLPLNY